MLTNASNTPNPAARFLSVFALYLLASHAAYAQSGPVTGSGTVTNSVHSFQDSTAVISGTADVSGNTLTADLVTDWNGGSTVLPIGFTTESTLVIDVTTGAGTLTFTSCAGFFLACDSFVIGVDNPYQATTYGFVGDAYLWTLQETVLAELTPGDGNEITIDDSYNAALSAAGASPSGDPAAVPVFPIPGLVLTIAGLLAAGIYRLRKVP